MVTIPESKRESDLSRLLLEAGLKRINQGKVRDTFELGRGLLAVLTTNRVSIFDYVLNADVPGKGRVLAEITNHNLRKVLRGIRHHLEAHGQEAVDYLPALPAVSDLWGQIQIVKKLRMIPLECIVRGYITGSGYKDYQATGMVCGIQLSAGLKDADRLPEPIFTPSTKSNDGHDQNIDAYRAAEIVAEEMGMPMDKAESLVQTLTRYSMEVYRQTHNHGLRRGIIVADTKLEFGFDDEGLLTLGDEVVTPDSSRNWLIHDWCVSPWVGKPPSGYDKEPVRQAGKKAILPDGREVDISSFKDPSDPEQIRIVQSWRVPAKVISATTVRYEALERMWIQ
ncbi:MAG: phosphoribosylaminoimidazolesuccinocarboxamide synthase [Candidatus Doudnabacteria bacterium]|nr:phosphoribosylaminoimidazolesuccinocarboxamide synthase [Candidatus Doudnabacteria bacterium]